MVALVEDQEIEFVFNKYAENGLMGRYGLKCSIIYLYGDDIKNEELKEYIHDSPISSLSEFKTSILSYQTSHDSTQKLLRKLFSAFDTKGRDYITRDNFLKLLQKVAPHLERNHGDRLFSTVDTLDIGKVTVSQFSLLCSNYSNLSPIDNKQHWYQK
mmetsp:Transcript_27865/g.26707  ORF Transcript_27865/g.26707 Transcript_27865/m.26707 type:complete len:157 (-) Transcript_27865:461-931(-)